MSELERFIEFWYGPRRPEYGEPIAANEYPELPGALRRFYNFAGRWPSPGAAEDDYFYAGHGGHHLLSLELVMTPPTWARSQTPKGRLRFFMEYQGDWSGVTEPKLPDPPVWIRGHWDDEEETQGTPKPRTKTRQVATSLSSFLITHCLMATVYESKNSELSHYGFPSPDGDKLLRWYGLQRKSSELLWKVPPGCCPHYYGQFKLIQEHILVLEVGRSPLRMCAIHPDGVALLRSVLGPDA